MRKGTMATLGLALLPLLGEPAARANDQGGWATAGWHLVRPGEDLQWLANRYLGPDATAADVARRNPSLERVRPASRVLVELSAGLPDEVAILTRLGGRVDAQPAPVPWLRGRRFDLLAEGDGLRTFGDASVEVAFADATRLRLTEESLVFLRRPSAPSPASSPPARRIEIVRGQADLAQSGGRPHGRRVEILLGAARALPRADADGTLVARTRRDPGGGAQLMVYRGSSQLSAGGVTVTVPAGSGSVVRAGGQPSPPAPLLSAPVLVAPAAGAQLPAAAQLFRWAAVPGAASYTFELCRDAACGELVRRRRGLRAADPSALLAGRDLPSGRFYWRVTASSGQGLDGFPSSSRELSLGSVPPEPVVAMTSATLSTPLVADATDALALAADGTPLVTHDEIDVRPSRLSLLSRDPVAPLALAREEVLALPHLGDDVFRALPVLPGTTATDKAAQFHVRGGRRDEVAIRLDGQELYDAFHLRDWDNAVSIVAPAALGAVELTTGGLPAAHGDRMSGALDLRTSEGDEGRRRWLGAGLFTQQAGAAGSFPSERGGWLAIARRGSTDLVPSAFGYERPTFWDAFGRADFRRGDRQSLRARALLSEDRLDIDVVDQGEPKQRRTRHGTSYLWLTHQALLGNAAVLDSRAAWSRLDSDRRALELDDDQQRSIDDRRVCDVLEMASDGTVQGGAAHLLSLGIGLRSFAASYDYHSVSHWDTPLALLRSDAREGPFRYAARIRGEHASAYLSDRLQPLPRLAVELGARYDRWSWLGEERWSPRLNVAWSSTERSVVRAGWGSYPQGQRPYELLVEDGETRFSPVERSTQSQLGFEHLTAPGGRLAGVAIRVEAYRREIRLPRPRYENLFQPFDTFPELEPDRVRVVAGRSRSQGIELFLRGPAARRVAWWGSYAYARSEDHIDGRWVPRQIDQPHSLTANLQLPVGRRWKLSAAWRYHTGWPTTQLGFVELPGDPDPLDEGDGGDDDPDDDPEPEPPGEPRVVPVLGPRNAERLPAYHRLDLRLSRELAVRRGRLNLFFDLQNLYDRRNVGGFDYALEVEERQLLAPVERWPGLIPSFGFEWEL